MRLTPNMAWPPATHTQAVASVQHDRRVLDGTHTTTQAPMPVTHRTQWNGGIVGGVSRAVLGRPAPHHGSATVKRHLPVAAELSEVVGDLLFGNAPRITADETEHPALLEALEAHTTTDQFAADLVEAGTSCSALGWVFGRVRWDTALDSHPWVEWLPADKGFATFTGNKLQEITFVDTYDQGKDVYRLTETHRPGEVEYSLWCGGTHTLGHRVPVTELAQTKHLADLLTQDSTIRTGSPLMTAVMVPNRAKNPAWATTPHLSMYGKSDIQFGGGIWDDIDKGYTDLWHEVDSARSRLLVSEDYLRNLGPGRGSVFDWWQDVYPLGPTATAEEPGRIERVQFDMRVDEYLKVVEYATRQAVGHFGLSPMTVGMDTTAGGDMTATEVARRERRTVNSWRARSRYWRAGLQHIMTAWAHVDAALNNYPAPQGLVTVAMVEPIQDTDADRARAAAEWATADAASTRTRVAHLHPEWSQAQIDEEVAEIERERGNGVPVDPFTLAPDVNPEP